MQRPLPYIEIRAPTLFQPVGPEEGRELAALVRIHDLGRAEAVDGRVQRFDAEVRLERVRDAPSQHVAGEPVHDRYQTQEPRHIGR
jgi:hypothetical protein